MEIGTIAIVALLVITLVATSIPSQPEPVVLYVERRHEPWFGCNGMLLIIALVGCLGFLIFY